MRAEFRWNLKAVIVTFLSLIAHQLYIWIRRPTSRNSSFKMLIGAHRVTMAPAIPVILFRKWHHSILGHQTRVEIEADKNPSMLSSGARYAYRPPTDGATSDGG